MRLHVISLVLLLAVTLSAAHSVNRPDDEADANRVLSRQRRTIGGIFGMFKNMMSNIFGGGKRGGKKNRGRPSSGYGVPKGRPISGGYGAPSKGNKGHKGNKGKGRQPRPRPSYGAPQGPPQRPGYGAPGGGFGGGNGGGHSGGGGGSNYGGGAPVSDGYGAPQGPINGGGDSYGSPQAPVVNNGGGNIDSYGSPQAAPIGNNYGGPQSGPVPPPGSYNAGQQQQNSHSGVIMAPASLSNTVIKMLPAPNLATGRPNTFPSSPSSSSYSSSSSSPSTFGTASSSSAQPAQDSYGTPTAGLVSNFNSFSSSSGGEQIVQATPTGAQNPFLVAALAGIQTTDGNGGSSSNYGAAAPASNSYSQGSNSGSSSFNFAPAPAQTNTFRPSAQQAPDSYGIPQGNPISNNGGGNSFSSAGNSYSNYGGNSFSNNNGGSSFSNTFSNNNNNNNNGGNSFVSNPVNSNFQPSAPAPDSYGIPQGNPISSNSGSQSSFGSPGVISNPAPASNGGFLPAAQAPNSYGVAQANPISQGNPFSTSNSQSSFGNPAPAPAFINNPAPAPAVQAPNSYGAGQANFNPVSNPGIIPRGNANSGPSFNNNNPATDVFGSAVAPVGTSAPVPEGILPKQPTSFDTYNNNNNVVTGGDSSAVVTTDSDDAPDAADDDTDIFRTEYDDDASDAPVGEVFSTVIEEKDPVTQAPATAPAAPTTQNRPNIQIDLVNGNGDVDLTNGVTNNDASVEVDLTNEKPATEEPVVKDLFPGYEDIEYDPAEYEDYYDAILKEADKRKFDTRAGGKLVDTSAKKNRSNLPGYGRSLPELTNDPAIDLRALGFDDPIDAEEEEEEAYAANEKSRQGKGPKLEKLIEKKEPAPFFEYSELESDAQQELDNAEDVEFISVPLMIEELDKDRSGVRGGDPTVILAGSPPDDEEEYEYYYEDDEDYEEYETTTVDERETTTLAPEPVTVRGFIRGFSRGRDTTKTTPRSGKKRVEDIPKEAFHSFLVEPPQGKDGKSNQNKRGVDWSQRLREKRRKRIWKQFRLN